MLEMDEIRRVGKLHCWECRRRYLVCDSTQLACKRCSVSGVQCPGYSEIKPRRFKWLAPGRIVSGNRRRKAAARSTNPDKNDSKVKTRTGKEVASTMRNEFVAIPHFEMKLHSCVLLEAAEYYNSCIYQDLVPLHAFGQNPHVYPVSKELLRAAVTTAPDYLKYGMVCITLTHRINRTRSDPESKALVGRFYLYWGIAARSLREHLEKEKSWMDDMVIAGILTLLLADIQQGTSLNWRCHFDGIHRLIALRGGFRALATSKSLEPMLLALLDTTVIKNTTCPASDLSMTGSQLDALDFITEAYAGAASSFQMCPLPLFAEIIRINHLRMQASSHDISEAASLSQDAFDILERVLDFSPELWAGIKSSSSRDDWILIVRVYRSAITLYCILSLQSLSVLPKTPKLRAQCRTHARDLKGLITQGVASPKAKRFMLWPLVLLGVEAVHSGAAMRAFVAKQLPELSYFLGSYVPLMAKHALERFWDSGETRWDACFDRPYVFTTQIAVNTSRLYPTGLIS